MTCLYLLRHPPRLVSPAIFSEDDEVLAVGIEEALLSSRSEVGKIFRSKVAASGERQLLTYDSLLDMVCEGHPILVS